MNANEREYEDLVKEVVGAVYEVSNVLGCGFLEKCADRLTNEHMAQCINYLRASTIEIALLVNFQKPRVEWKRIILSH